MNNEQRIEAAQRLMIAAAADPQPRDCSTCRYAASFDSYSGPKCTAALVRIESKSDVGVIPTSVPTSLARSSRGLCGPDTLLWANRGWRHVLPRYRQTELGQLVSFMTICVGSVLALTFFIVTIINLSV